MVSIVITLVLWLEENAVMINVHTSNYQEVQE